MLAMIRTLGAPRVAMLHRIACPVSRASFSLTPRPGINIIKWYKDNAKTKEQLQLSVFLSPCLPRFPRALYDAIRLDSQPHARRKDEIEKKNVLKEMMTFVRTNSKLFPSEHIKG